MNYEKLPGGITATKGFKAAGVDANISGNQFKKNDVALIFSEVPAVSAAVFTKNLVKAAPVIISNEILKKGELQAIIVNSRNANACTGPQGIKDAQEMCQLTAKLLNTEEEVVSVASTGVIGVFLRMDNIRILCLQSRL